MNRLKKEYDDYFNSFLSPKENSASAPKEKEIFEHLKSKGLDDNKALGVLSNLKHESAFKPDAVGDSGTSGGMFQHHNERLTALSERVPDWKTNWKGQVDFALDEPEGQDYLRQNFDTPEDASRYFTKNFERPANADDEAEKRASDLTRYYTDKGFRVTEDDSGVHVTRGDPKKSTREEYADYFANLNPDDLPDLTPETNYAETFKKAVKNADLTSAAASAAGPLGLAVNSDVGDTVKRLLKTTGAEIATPAAKLLSRVAPDLGNRMGRKLQEIEETPPTAYEEKNNIDLSQLANTDLLKKSNEKVDAMFNSGVKEMPDGLAKEQLSKMLGPSFINHPQEVIRQAGASVGLGPDNPFIAASEEIIDPIVNLAHGLATPKNAALLAVPGGAAAFIPGAAEGAIEGVETLKEGQKDGDFRKKIRGGTEAVLNTILGIGMAGGHGKSEAATLENTSSIKESPLKEYNLEAEKDFSKDQIAKAVAEKEVGEKALMDRENKVLEEAGYTPENARAVFEGKPVDEFIPDESSNYRQLPTELNPFKEAIKEDPAVILGEQVKPESKLSEKTSQFIDYLNEERQKNVDEITNNPNLSSEEKIVNIKQLNAEFNNAKSKAVQKDKSLVEKERKAKIKEQVNAVINRYGDPFKKSEFVIEEPVYPQYSRDNLIKDLKSKFLLPDEKVSAVLAVSDARAEAWAKLNDRSPEEWYSSRLANVERGEKGRGLQQKGKESKGSVEFLKDGRAVIKAFEKADVSTAVHELSHVFRKDLVDTDLKIIKDWVGVEGDKWERHHEEKFARGFEKYLKTGKAPNATLTRIFDKFKEWMSDIYKKLKGSSIDVQIPDAVRKVYDNLLGGRDEISPNMIEGFNFLKNQIESAEAGYRMPKDIDTSGVGGSQEWVGSESTFPVKDTGLSKKEQIDVINKILNDENLTERQSEASAGFYEFAKKYEEEKAYHDELSKAMAVEDTSFDFGESHSEPDVSTNNEELFQASENEKGQKDLIEPRKKWATKIDFKSGKEKVVRVGGEKVPQELMDEAKNFKDVTGAQTQYKDLDRAVENVTKENYPTYRKYLIEAREDAVTAMTREHASYKDKIDREIIKNLGIKVGSKESAAVMQYGEGRLKLEDLKSQFPKKWEDIVKADKLFRGWYEEILKSTNEVLISQGKKPIPRRENYYTHARDVSNIFEKFFEKDNIDPQLAGISQFTKPTQSWNPFAQRRKGPEAFVDDAVHVFDSYLRPTLIQKHITPIIARYRAFSDALASEAGKNNLKLNNFIEMIHDHANALAGKTNPMDRWVQKVVGRKLMNVVDIAAQRLGVNSIVGNIGSIVMQGSSLPATTAYAGPFNVAKGLLSTLADTMAGKDTAFEVSPFLQRRYTEVDPFKKTTTRKITDIVGKPLGIFERYIVESAWRANHAKALDNGLTGFEAIKDADFKTGRQIGNRDFGAKNLMFQSKLGNISMQFQLEVNNMMQHYFHDLGFKNKKQLAKLVVYSHLFNLGMKQLMNRTPIFDPLGATIDASTQEKDKKDTTAEDLAKRFGRLVGEVLGNMAGGQSVAMVIPENTRKKYFGKTDFGIYGGGPPLLSSIQKGFKKPSSIVTSFGLPFGGSQYKKTSEGIQAIKEAKLTGTDKAKAVVFGPYSVEGVGKSRKNKKGEQKFYKNKEK